ncbi:MAG: prepilin-type N-terminal cleavage/methylation domain-containing protein [Candidatus Euphemobacter frigidus]|nr:prepilin-type N-terminal cleavage/methylation domain-containing protein [Candidatus Euphemobacter frigidus]MDP8275563.1 prepilin-type N-terminal cleavage/methylation domain-containing protein [Candidatus Euphemobacter frigidus]
MKAKANSNNAGFTLMEILIVVLIIGILAIAIIPKILSTTQFSALLAAEMAVTDIRATQTAAMFESALMTIQFNGDSTYIMGGITKTLPGGATSGAYTITFNSFGEPTVGVGTFTITSGPDNKSITILALTGKTTIN